MTDDEKFLEECERVPRADSELENWCQDTALPRLIRMVRERDTKHAKDKEMWNEASRGRIQRDEENAARISTLEAKLGKAEKALERVAVLAFWNNTLKIAKEALEELK